MRCDIKRRKFDSLRTIMGSCITPKRHCDVAALNIKWRTATWRHCEAIPGPFASLCSLHPPDLGREGGAKSLLQGFGDFGESPKFVSYQDLDGGARPPIQKVRGAIAPPCPPLCSAAPGINNIPCCAIHCVDC